MHALALPLQPTAPAPTVIVVAWKPYVTGALHVPAAVQEDPWHAVVGHTVKTHVPASPHVPTRQALVDVQSALVTQLPESPLGPASSPASTRPEGPPSCAGAASVTPDSIFDASSPSEHALATATHATPAPATATNKRLK